MQPIQTILNKVTQSLIPKAMPTTFQEELKAIKATGKTTPREVLDALILEGWVLLTDDRIAEVMRAIDEGYEEIEASEIQQGDTIKLYLGQESKRIEKVTTRSNPIILTEYIKIEFDTGYRELEANREVWRKTSTSEHWPQSTLDQFKPIGELE